MTCLPHSPVSTVRNLEAEQLNCDQSLSVLDRDRQTYHWHTIPNMGTKEALLSLINCPSVFQALYLMNAHCSSTAPSLFTLIRAHSAFCWDLCRILSVSRLSLFSHGHVSTVTATSDKTASSCSLLLLPERHTEIYLIREAHTR